jgi:hypothetical protein
LERAGRKRSCLNLGCYLGICLERLKKRTEPSVPARELNPGFLEYEASETLFGKKA